MPLTSLNLNLVAATAASAALIRQFGASLITAATCFALEAVALLIHRRPDPALTVQDRCLINIDRLSKGQQPNAAMISVCMYIKSSQLPTASDAKVALEYPIQKHAARFSSIPDETASLEDSTWKRVDIDLTEHVISHETLVGGSQALEARINNLVNETLSRDRPLWRLDILPSDGPEGCVVLRASHAIADGLRLVSIAGDFLSFGNGSPASLEVLSRLSANKLAMPPRHLADMCKDLVEAATLDQLCNEDPTCFHTPGSLFPRANKRSTVSSWVSMDDIKAIRSSSPAETTINDIVLSAFVAAIKRYANAVNHPLTERTLLRALCVASLPDDPKRKGALYNDFIMPSIRLPVGPDGREDRLRAVHSIMDAAKRSYAGFFMGRLLTVAARLGLDAVVGQTQNTVFGKHAFVFSNMPGFTEPVHLLLGAGARVERFAVYNPNLISQCFFLSYNGELCFSLSTDAATVVQPSLLVESFAEEVSEWAARVGR